MKKQFTLIELLAVITIVGIMATMAVTGIPAIIEKTRDMSCRNNLKNLGTSAAAYASNDALTAYYPGGRVVRGNSWVGRLALASNVNPDENGNYFINLNKKPTSMFTCSNDISSADASQLAEEQEGNDGGLSFALSYVFNAGAIADNQAGSDVSTTKLSHPSATAYLLETHGSSDFTKGTDADPLNTIIDVGFDDPEGIRVNSPHVVYKVDPSKTDLKDKEFFKKRIITFANKNKSSEDRFYTLSGTKAGAKIHGKTNQPKINAVMFDGSTDSFDGRIEYDKILYRKR